MYNAQKIYTRVKTEAKRRKINTTDMLEDCKLSKNTLSRLNNGQFPSCECIAKIADFLQCSIDYLMCRTDNPNIARENLINQQVTNSPANGSITLNANGKKTEIETLEQEILEELKKLNFIEKSEIISCIAKIKKEKTDI